MVFTASPTYQSFYITRNASTNSYKVYLFGSAAFITLAGQWIADSNWRHITFTAEKSGTAVKLTSYVNGVFNGTNTSGTWNTSNITYIQLYGYNLTFQGNLDDMRFFNKVLTQKEINDVYTNSIYSQNVITRRVSLS